MCECYVELFSCYNFIDCVGDNHASPEFFRELRKICLDVRACVCVVCVLIIVCVVHCRKESPSLWMKFKLV